MKSALNKKSFFIALVFAAILLSGYEWYWGNVKHWPKGHDLESLDIWAEQRKKVASLDEDDVIIIGSSRAHFDLNINLWDSLTGRRPLQLAYPGSSPFHPFGEIVNNTEFKGLLVVGVAPGLFFTVDKSWAANRGKALVDHYYNRTYAQAFNQKVYQYIDPHFSYLQQELSLKKLVDRLPFPERDSVSNPEIWPPMVAMDENRNIRMTPQMETDTVLQRRQKDIWFNPDPKNRYKDSIEVIMNYYIGLVEKFQDRGGRVAFIRAPITGYYLEIEPKLFPREAYWDRLIRECNCVGYHFADHPATRQMDPPEWSHLNRVDSDTYTRLIIEFLIEDNLL